VWDVQVQDVLTRFKQQVQVEKTRDPASQAEEEVTTK